ncbi:MAG: NUDIX hydrolase [Bacillota bacterium]
MAQEIHISCRGIAVVLLKRFGDEFRVLLMKRATPTMRGMWCYVGGGIEQGEKATQAAMREIREETGLTRVALYISNTFEQFYSVRRDDIYMAPVFVGYVDEEEAVVLNYEHSEFAWLSFSEARERVSLPGNEEVLEHVEKYFAKRQPLRELCVTE